MNGDAITGHATIDTHVGLRIVAFDPPWSDAMMRGYARGLRCGLSYCNGEDALEMGTRRARENGVPLVIDVIVELAHGPREFTWTEFTEWTDA